MVTEKGGWMAERGRAAERREEPGGRASVLRSDALRLRQYVKLGMLSEADAYEVQETLELLIERVQSGAITDHFARLVIKKLAADKLEAWVYRTADV